MDPHELMMTALRALGVYVLMLVVIRALGKRTVGNFSAFDLLVALMLGEVVDEIIYGDVSIAQGAGGHRRGGGRAIREQLARLLGPRLRRPAGRHPDPDRPQRRMLDVKGMRAERMNAKEVMARAAPARASTTSAR